MAAYEIIEVNKSYLSLSALAGRSVDQHAWASICEVISPTAKAIYVSK